MIAEAAALLQELRQYETFKNDDLPEHVKEKMTALHVALEAEPDRCVIVRYDGTEIYYLVEEETLEPNDWEAEVPLAIRQRGILQALRVILGVGHLESIFTVAIKKMRRLAQLEQGVKEVRQEAGEILSFLGKEDNRGKQ